MGGNDHFNLGRLVGFSLYELANTLEEIWTIAGYAVGRDLALVVLGHERNLEKLLLTSYRLDSLNPVNLGLFCLDLEDEGLDHFS